MLLAIPVDAGALEYRAQAAYYAGRRCGSLVPDQAAITGAPAPRPAHRGDAKPCHAMMAALPAGSTHAPCCSAECAPMSARALLAVVFAVFNAAMLGLAAGAVWLVVMLYAGQPLPWLALPTGALLAWSIRHWVRPPGAGTALLAALTTALAACYLGVLFAGVMLAGSMNMGLLDALRTAGAGMLWQLARLAMAPLDLGWLALAMLLAAWLAWRAPRPR
jgi:hypothetical protein